MELFRFPGLNGTVFGSWTAHIGPVVRGPFLLGPVVRGGVRVKVRLRFRIRVRFRVRLGVRFRVRFGDKEVGLVLGLSLG